MNKITVSKGGKGKTVCIPLSVYRVGRTSLTISCADQEHPFKFGTSPTHLEKFRKMLNTIFATLVGDEQPKRATLHAAIVRIPVNLTGDSART